MDDGLLICASCHHYFDPATGEVSEKYSNVTVVNTDKEFCKPCTKEKDMWPRG